MERGWRPLRQPAVLKDSEVGTTVAEGTWWNTKEGRLRSQRDWMGPLPTAQEGRQTMLERSFDLTSRKLPSEIYGIQPGLCPPM